MASIADPEHGLSMNVQGNKLARLRELFPDAFTEDGIDFEVFKEILGDQVNERSERFSFNWFGKAAARRISQTATWGTLRPDIEKSVEFESSDNLFIEGDNLEVLKLLQGPFHRRVKMIFIDPPYNTGRDFIYSDDFRDNLNTYLRYSGQLSDDGRKVSANSDASGRYHTNWLNMMFPRLRLARNLLREDGVIFITIDDTEVANLRKLCDEVFGEENFVVNVVWQKKYTRANDAKWFSDNHDHVLCYARQKEALKLHLLPRNEAQMAAYSNPDNHPKGPWKATPLHAKSGADSSAYTFSNGITWRPPTGTFRRFSNDTMQRLDALNEIWFGSDGRQTPSRKSFLSEVKSGITPVTIWPYDEVGHNHEANNELKELGLGGDFDHPKPTRLIRRMCVLSDTPAKDGIVLDFFAGSGTTADAVMRQNAEDNGTRRFILIQLPEKCDENSQAFQHGFNTISDTSRERLRKAISRIESANAELTKTEKPLGFKSLRLDSSNIKSWDVGPEPIEHALLDSISNIKDDRSEVDVLYELLIRYNLDLAVPIERRDVHNHTVFIVGFGALVVCLAEEITLDMIESIGALQSELKPDVMRVVFNDTGFADDATRTSAVQILRQRGIEDVKSL